MEGMHPVARQFRPDEQQRLNDVLGNQAALLILDNFEAIAEDGEVLRWLKTISSPSATLVVSRQKVPYLGAPTLTLDELKPAEAKQLFIQRAHNAGWDGTEAEDIPRLCELVGNLPLAIELLAPRAAELRLTVLEDMVSKSLDALTTEKDSFFDERRQSIAACFQVSFDRLSEDARNLLMRFSVLPDGVGERMIAPFTGIEEWQKPITECVRQSLLRLEEQRYYLHPLVRRFALGQLGDATPEWQRRFVTFFSQLVMENNDINNLDKLAVLDAEWRNATAAAEIAEQLKLWNEIDTLSEYMGDFLELRGLWSEIERLNQRALVKKAETRELEITVQSKRKEALSANGSASVQAKAASRLHTRH